MRALLIVNPNATSTTTAGRDVLGRALSTGLDLQVVHTERRGHAADLAREAVAGGVGLVVVHGGDGTVNEAVNGLLGPPSRWAADPARAPLLGIVPGGSANVFARSLGIPEEPMEATRALLQAVAAGARRRTGLGTADDRWFTFNAGVGWDAEVVAAVERRRARGKVATPGRYVRAALRGYVRTRRHPARLTAEVPHPGGGTETVPDLHLLLVSATDPWTYAGDLPVHVNPGTRHDHGLGVFGLRSLGVPTMARVVPSMLRRGGEPRSRALLRRDDVAWARVRCTGAEEIDLQLDGDHLGTRREVEFRRVHDALDVAVAPRATGPDPR